MNDYLLSLILGIVEGLTEFLPISSTAHLRIAEYLLAIDLKNPFWKMYSIVIQLGAILAVVVYFWRRLAEFARTYPLFGGTQKPADGSPKPNLWTHPLTLVLIAFVVTAAPSYLLHKKIGQNLESLWVMGGALLVGGVVMWLVDASFRRPKITDIKQMTVLDAVWIGAVQILSAVFPGTSRSMCTIAAGQIFGMSRAAALEFSFFLSIPTMVVATGYELLKTLHPKSESGERLAPLHVSHHQWLIVAIGFAVSFIVAWGVIAWFMRWVRRQGFAPFAVYRILLGAWVLYLASRGVGKA